MSVPFELEDGQNVSYVVYYLAPDGSAERISDVSYADGTLSFSTVHFSLYAVLIETPSDSGIDLPLLAATVAVWTVIIVGLLLLLPRRQ